MTYFRQDGESEEELIYRIGLMKNQIGSWDDVADVLNEILGYEYSESKYRKSFHAIEKMMAKQAVDAETDQMEQIREFLKDRQKIADERASYRRVIREEARKESFLDMVRNIITENIQPLEFNPKNANLPQHDNMANDLLVHITDMHAGIEIENFFRTFNQEVLIKEMETYINRILTIKETHKSENCYVVISEILSGIIHSNLRLENNMDLMQQFKFATELITQALVALSENFNAVYVYTAPGNHSRISPKKEDSLSGENMDILIPYYLKARLQNYKNIQIFENTINNDMAMFNIRGQIVYAAHGDKDSPQNVVQNCTMLYGIKPNIILLGHRHTNALYTETDCKIIQSGCFSGTDEYAYSIRKKNRPEQTVSVVDSTGLVCVYDVKLD